MRLVYCLCLFMAFPVFGAVTGGDFTVNGFGTLGASALRTSNRYLAEHQAKGDDLNYLANSNLGLNISTRLNGRSRAVIQSIMLGSADFDPKVDLAFFSVEALKDLTFYAGRIVVPVWMFSEEQSIGYSYMWIRPPQQLYLAVPFRNLDGLGVRYNRSVGSFMARLQISGGRGLYEDWDRPADISLHTRAEVKDALSAELRLEKDDVFGVRIGYSRATARVHTEMELIGAGPGDPSQGLDSTNVRTSKRFTMDQAKLYSLGATGKLGAVQLVGELMLIESDGNTLTRLTGGYLTGGYAFGEWTPHFTWAWQRDAKGTYFSTIEGDGFVKGSNSYTFGVNYTGLENVVLKAGASQTAESFWKRDRGNTYMVYSLVGSFIF